MSCSIPVEYNLKALQPRLGKIPIGEQLFIIGCEYADYDCHQKIYKATFNDYYEEMLVLKPEQEFNASGFSGAPVVDNNGLVVGVLSGGIESGGIEYYLIESINSIK